MNADDGCVKWSNDLREELEVHGLLLQRLLLTRHGSIVQDANGRRLLSRRIVRDLDRRVNALVQVDLTRCERHDEVQVARVLITVDRVDGRGRQSERRGDGLQGLRAEHLQ